VHMNGIIHECAKIAYDPNLLTKFDDDLMSLNTSTSHLVGSESPLAQHQKPENNIYRKFVLDNLEQTNNKKDTISVTNLYVVMKQWYKINYNDKCPSIKELRNYLEKQSKNYDKKCDTLFGYKIKDLDIENINDLDNM